MTRKVLYFATIGLIFQSCGFWFYNYRASYDSNFIIPNENADTTIRYKVGQMIFRQSFKSDLYHRFASKTYDTLSFYGPDYHTLKFRISESNKSTNVHFNKIHSPRSVPFSAQFVDQLHLCVACFHRARSCAAARLK